jgi:hypothetical protein
MGRTEKDYWVWYYTRLNNGEWMHVKAYSDKHAREIAERKIFGLLKITHVADIDPALHNGEL